MDKSMGDMNTMAAGRDRPGGYTLSVDETLGQYRIVRLLGRGGMGEVYEAEHVTLYRRYALKLLPAEFAATPGALERFRREARVMANLDHPHIIKVDDFGESDGRYWLRMELANGLRHGGREVTSLQDLAAAGGGRVEQKSLSGILTQILQALKHAHGHGAVHRDLKPSNILIFTDSDGSVFKIADFGLVRLIGEEWVRGQAQLSVQSSLSMGMSLGDRRTLDGEGDSSAGTSTRSLLGTYEYMSPEQKRGAEATAQSDIYSVGLMAFKLLTGQNLGLKAPSRIDAALNKGWDALLERALEENAGERWASAGEMLRALEAIGGQETGYGGQRAEERSQKTEDRSQNGGATKLVAKKAASAAVLKAGHNPGDTQTVDLGGGVKLELVWCPAGSYTRGSPANEAGRFDDETQHRVTLTKGFWMGKHEVTQAQWEAVTGSNPSHFKNAGKSAPVESVSWDDCQEFVRKLNAKLAAREDARPPEGGGFRLPTEAEWEYACRAGTTTAICSGPLTIRGANNGPELDAIAWYGGNSGVDYAGGYDSSGWKEKQYDHKTAGTHPVGQKKPNAWGLYDMHGNVWEWCQDWYGDYPTGSVTDPAGPVSGSLRVFRGGSWIYFARICRSAYRMVRPRLPLHLPGLAPREGPSMILDGAMAVWRTEPLAAKRAKGARPTAAGGCRGAPPAGK